MPLEFSSFEEFFSAATHGRRPYPYQSRLAICKEFPQVLSVPTGVGKTAAAILSWVYRRRFASEEIQKKTPRRLIYCLPMRTLVEQTQAAALQWLAAIKLNGSDPGEIEVHQLMGGSDSSKWAAHPERDTILIGTQDMLLSRALNRGYGMSRFQWPMHYGLLNNDCQWVIDETQLMGVGLTTSAQLAGLREKLKTYGNSRTMWMSATMDSKALATIDHPLPESGWRAEQLQADDQADENVMRLIIASKPCEKAKTLLTLESDKKGYEISLAEEVLSAHQSGTLTLIVMNRVSRAQKLYQAIQKQLKKGTAGAEIVLIHSRFRPSERMEVQTKALDENNIPSEGRIVVATQAIEAGIDLSATTLFTELAPWSSLVQRFGRCNRRGTCGLAGTAPARVVWIDLDLSDPRKSKELALPYCMEELNIARQTIERLTDAGPQTLSLIQVDPSSEIVHVIRRKDLLDLFDTTADLSGNDLDISRYIREGEDSDIQVYWRKWPLKGNGVKTAPPDPGKTENSTTFPLPARAELCAVSVFQFRAFLQNLRKHEKTKFVTWRWDPLLRQWDDCSGNEIRPGMLVLLHVSAGGYDPSLGWTGDPKSGPVSEVLISKDSEKPVQGDVEAMDEDDRGSLPVLLTQHLRDVAQAAGELQNCLPIDEKLPWEQIIRAAWWHDVGKAHPAFQGALRRTNTGLPLDQLWAKSGGEGRLIYTMPDDSRRPGFRHELASALAWLAVHSEEPHANLIAYLIAAHHGKVRMSLRSMPNEKRPKDARLFARGIWDQDELEQVEIGNESKEVSLKQPLSLDLMELGEQDSGKASWLARSLSVRDEYGPFRLAYLETLLRVADWRGSEKKVTS